MKKALKVVYLALMFAFSASFSLAAEVHKAGVEKFTISFEQAYELMLANNNAIKVSLEAIEEKKYEKKASYGHFLPKIALSSTYARLDNPIEMSVSLAPLAPVTKTLTLQERDFWSAQFIGMWNIFTGGKIWAQHTAKKAKLEGADYKHTETLNNLAIELVKRYYGLALSDEMLKVRAQVLNGVERHLNDAKMLEEVGMIPKSERLHAEVAYSQALRDYNLAKRECMVIQEGLKSLIKEDKVDLSDVEVTASSNLFIYNGEIPPLNEFKKLASENNTSLKQLDVKKKLMQANYRASAANYSPTVSLFAYDMPAQSQVSHAVPRYAAGVSANMLLFDGLTRQNELKAANSLRKQVAYEIADADLNIETLVNKQYQEVLKHKEHYETSEAAILSAQEALRVCEIGFREGIYTSLSVIDAQMALSKVKIERLSALYNYDLALCELLATSGSASGILDYIKNSKTEKTGL